MPYRAMLWTILAVGVALVSVGLWIRAVEPPFATAVAATRIAPSTHPTTQPGADVKVRAVIHVTLLCSFILICLMLVLGVLATFREWLRYQTLRPERKAKKTQYVDIWKIAGERLKEKKETDDPDGPLQ